MGEAVSKGVVDAGRRSFLKWSTAVSAFVSAALAGIPVLRAFVSPTFRRASSETWIKLGDVETFDLDIPTKVDFVETVTDAWVENRALRSVWVYTEDGETFIVYSGRCTHLGCGYHFDKGPDQPWHDRKDVFHCPCHHGLFDLKSGAVVGGPPPRALDRLETKIENGDLYTAYRDFRVGVPEKVAV